MKIRLSIMLALVCELAVSDAYSRDDRTRYSIDMAMNVEEAKLKLNQGFTFKFGAQPHAAIKESYGEFTSNKKTNAFGKSDATACQHAFLSAMLSFQDRIAKEGGNAVINVRSFYKKAEFTSETEFECGNGAIMAGVTFVGDVVTLE